MKLLRRHRSRPCPRARRAFTLVEMMIAMVTLTVILGAVALAALQGQDAFQAGRMVSDLELRTRRAVDRIVDELGDARRDGLFPDPAPPFGSSTLDFQRNQGFAGGNVVWSDPLRIVFEYEATDPDDGVDNDSDGLVDEGRVVRLENPGDADEQRIVLTSWVSELLEGELPNGADDNGNGLVDESGLCFESNGDTITVRLTLERWVDGGSRITRTVQTAVTLRN